MSVVSWHACVVACLYVSSFRLPTTQIEEIKPMHPETKKQHQNVPFTCYPSLLCVFARVMSCYCMWLAHHEAGCQCIACQIYVAESKLLQLQNSIEKVLEAGKLPGPMFTIMKSTQGEVKEECAVFMLVQQRVYCLSMRAIAMCICGCVSYRL